MKHICRVLLPGALACAMLFAAVAPASAQSAPDATSVLILGSTVSGGAGSVEAVKAAGLGYTVVVDSDAAWLARSTADFGTFRAIILGDPTCSYPASPYLDAADASKATWGPAIDGNVLLIGSSVPIPCITGARAAPN